MTFAAQVSTQVSPHIAMPALADKSRYWRLYSLTLWIGIAIQCRERRRQRKALLQLDQRMLADIGITRSQALQQALKPFWE